MEPRVGRKLWQSVTADSGKSGTEVQLLPLPAGKSPQTPGEVPASALEAMEHHISKLREKKDYNVSRK